MKKWNKNHTQIQSKIGGCMMLIPTFFHHTSYLSLVPWPTGSLPELIPACHFTLGSVHSEACSRRPPQVLKTDVTGLLKWVISTALLLSAATARMHTKLSSPRVQTGAAGCESLEDKVTEAHSWQRGSTQNYLLMRFSILCGVVELELVCLKAVQHTVRDEQGQERGCTCTVTKNDAGVQ